jgi:hypothetical protein
LLVDWCRALVPSSVPSSAVFVELEDQLLARERELDSREGAIIAWEESQTSFARVLREACMGHDARHANGGVIRYDYLG